MITRRGAYGEAHYQEHLIEQYKLYVEMLEGSNKRRMDTNTLFISINTIMVTFSALFNEGKVLTLGLKLVCGTGLLFSFVWYLLLVNYNAINTVKWAVVYEMESHLPCNPFEAEWKDPDKVGEQHGKTRYWSISKLEKLLPIVFAALYLVIGYHAWKNGVSANATDLSETVTALQDAVSDLTAALAEIARAGLGS